MQFVDPVQLEALIQRVEAESAPLAAAPGVPGSLARTVGVARAFYEWQAVEIERGTSPGDMARAIAFAFGSMLGAMAQQTAEPGAAEGIVCHLMDCAAARAFETLGGDHGSASVRQAPHS